MAIEIFMRFRRKNNLPTIIVVHFRFLADLHRAVLAQLRNRLNSAKINFRTTLRDSYVLNKYIGMLMNEYESIRRIPLAKKRSDSDNNAKPNDEICFAQAEFHLLLLFIE